MSADILYIEKDVKSLQNYKYSSLATLAISGIRSPMWLVAVTLESTHADASIAAQSSVDTSWSLASQVRVSASAFRFFSLDSLEN